MANKDFLARLRFWHRTPKPTAQASAVEAQTTPQSFYERAIEWTHRADKVINLVLGYLLAIASVLGFMDVLSNGEVLTHAPAAFYVWLAIMGLGVDFQIFLVIGRFPDLTRQLNGWLARIVFIVFNLAFLGFLCYMSVIIAAVFTQHRDVPGTIAQSMNALGIDSAQFVYERAALATLLLVLMAVDRTMERWRMQLQRSAQPSVNASAPVQSTQPEVGELEKLLNAMQAMNQQNLQAMQSMMQHSLQVSVERLTKVTIEAMQDTMHSLPAMRDAKLLNAPDEAMSGFSEVLNASSGSALDADSKPLNAESHSATGGYRDAIESLLNAQPTLNATEIAERIGCNERTAYKWMRVLRGDSERVQ